MIESLYDPKPMRVRAEDLRTMADTVSSPEARGVLLRLAADYDLLADRAEARRDAKTELTSAC